MEQAKRSFKERTKDIAPYLIIALLIGGFISGMQIESGEIPEPTPTPLPPTPTHRGISDFYATAEARGTHYIVPVRTGQTPTQR